MLTLAADEAKAKSPVKILITGGELDIMMERPTVNQDWLGWTLEAGVGVEANLMEVMRHCEERRLDGSTKTKRTPFYTPTDKGNDETGLERHLSREPLNRGSDSHSTSNVGGIPMITINDSSAKNREDKQDKERLITNDSR